MRLPWSFVADWLVIQGGYRAVIDTQLALLAERRQALITAAVTGSSM